MKRTVIFYLITVLSIANASAQQNPVQWETTVKKISNNVYEVHVKALIESSWHLYSQTTPPGGPLPSEIVFSKNPVANFDGAVKEMGELKKEHSEVFGVDVLYFNNTVDFVQRITTRGIKTNISGTVKYMVCNDKQCLPPKTIPIQVKLD
jgi:hypothetical protein